MEDFDRPLECLLQRGAERLRGRQRRLFMAEVTLGACGGSARRAERRFGWGRATVQKGLHELHKGIRCVENFSARGRPRWEEQSPAFEQDVRGLVVALHAGRSGVEEQPALHEPVGPRSVGVVASQEGLGAGRFAERTDDARHPETPGFSPQTHPEGSAAEERFAETEAIFANIRQVRQEAKRDAGVLEISVDTKAKVHEGDYARGGKNPDRLGRPSGARLGSRSAAEAEMDAAGRVDISDGGLDADVRRRGDE
jgi:hypothetical protein